MGMTTRFGMNLSATSLPRVRAGNVFMLMMELVLILFGVIACSRD